MINRFVTNRYKDETWIRHDEAICEIEMKTNIFKTVESRIQKNPKIIILQMKGIPVFQNMGRHIIPLATGEK